MVLELINLIKVKYLRYYGLFFEGGRHTYIILVSIYLFVPYLSNELASNPVEGQRMVAEYSLYSGLFISLLAPLIGSVADEYGPRKPLMWFVTVAMIILLWSLWWSKSDLSGLSIDNIVAILLTLNILFACSEVLHNSMLLHVAGREYVHYASGMGMSLGNGVSFIILIFTILFFYFPGHYETNWLPDSSLFGLSINEHEPERLAGPLTATLLILCGIPFLLFAKDHKRTGRSFLSSLSSGVKKILQTMLLLRNNHTVAKYLLARMLFSDAITTVVIFSGVYASGVMKWHGEMLLFYGVIMSFASAIGGRMAAFLDNKLGARSALIFQLMMTIAGLMLLVGTGRQHVAFIPIDYILSDNTLLKNIIPDVSYFIFSFSNAMFITATFASSRTLLVRLTPPSESGKWFGLYALSGTITAWLAPVLVLWSTEAFNSQQAGMVALVLLLMLSVWVMKFIPKLNF